MKTFCEKHQQFYLQAGHCNYCTPEAEIAVNTRGPKAATLLWLNEGKPHRLNGPAKIYNDGSEEYWVGGEPCTREEYPHAMEEYSLRESSRACYTSITYTIKVSF